MQIVYVTKEEYAQLIGQSGQVEVTRYRVHVSELKVGDEVEVKVTQDDLNLTTTAVVKFKDEVWPFDYVVTLRAPHYRKPRD